MTQVIVTRNGFEYRSIFSGSEKFRKFLFAEGYNRNGNEAPVNKNTSVDILKEYKEEEVTIRLIFTLLLN